MSIEVKKIDLSEGACNACDGKLSKTGIGLDYNYDSVYKIKCTSISIRLCPSCMRKMLVQTIQCVENLESEIEK